MKKQLLLCTAAIALISAAIWFAACQKEPSAPELSATSTEVSDRDNANSKVYPRTAKPHGQSYTEWSVNWWHWALSMPCATNPIFDPSGTKAGNNQSGPVYYLAGSGVGQVTRNVTIPHGKDIFFPVFNVIIDYPCAPDPAWEPAPGQTVEELLMSLGWLMDMVNLSNMEVKLDGTTLDNPGSYRFFPPHSFKFTGDPDLANCFDWCINGDEQDGWSDGYWIMLKPLSKGQHTLHFHAEVTEWGWIQDVTYNITIP